VFGTAPLILTVNHKLGAVTNKTVMDFLLRMQMAMVWIPPVSSNVTCTIVMFIWLGTYHFRSAIYMF
jgi:hypothetical protein